MILLKPEDLGIDYSKAEFKTFAHVGTRDGEEYSDLYDYDGFKKLCAELTDGAKIFQSVMKAIELDEARYRYVGFGEGTDYQEIQWD